MSIHQDYKMTQSVVTPLAKQAVVGFKYAFCYLYSSVFEIGIDTNGFVFLKAIPLTRKHIPFLISATVITGIGGWGSCLYVLLAQLTGVELKSWVKWNLFNTMLTLGLFLAASFEIFSSFVVYNSSFALQSINKLLQLEHKCKFS